MVATRKLTYTDYEQFPDDDIRREIIDGEVFGTPSPLDPHQAISITRASLLYLHARDLGLGIVRAAPYTVIFGANDVFERTYSSCARDGAA